MKGAFSYINDYNDVLIFPKQFDFTYPYGEEKLLEAKLEGLCRTLLIAVPLLKENKELTINSIKVLDYYISQINNIVNEKSPIFTPHYKGNKPTQILVEFGEFCLSLTVGKEILWNPLHFKTKKLLAETLLSYGLSPTNNSNWMYFNVLILSFIKMVGYKTDLGLRNNYLLRLVNFYSGGKGWYKDTEGYDYYSMWVFQTFGVIWANYYYEINPDLADKIINYHKALISDYPYLFGREGKMIFFGRSLIYRFGSFTPLSLLGFMVENAKYNISSYNHINFGFLRYISSSGLLQFLENPYFLQDRVPTMGIYFSFSPFVQGYSCRGSTYFVGQIFFNLLLNKTNPYWTSEENIGEWEDNNNINKVNNRFQEGSNMLITIYISSGISEIRMEDLSIYHSLDYNKLAYNSEFPLMKDSDNGIVSMNYGTNFEREEKWFILDSIKFIEYKNGVYKREGEINKNQNNKINFYLNDIPLDFGFLKIDKIEVNISSTQEVILRFGHYSLPIYKDPFSFYIHNNMSFISNRNNTLAMINLYGWDKLFNVSLYDSHPEYKECALLLSEKQIFKGEYILVTLILWKRKETFDFTNEISSIKLIKVEKNKVIIKIKENKIKEINF